MHPLQVCKTLLNQWLNDYQNLHDLLNSEQSALEKREFARMRRLLREKEDLLSQINQQQLPSRHDNQPQPKVSITDVRKFCESEIELLPKWQELMRLVDQCCFKNEVNAKLVELLLNANKRTFNLIKGFDPDNNLYDAKGDRSLVRHFGEALSA